MHSLDPTDIKLLQHLQQDGRISERQLAALVYRSPPVVVTVFPDDSKKYQSTDPLKTEPVKPGYLTPEVELIRYRVFDKA